MYKNYPELIPGHSYNHAAYDFAVYDNNVCPHLLKICLLRASSNTWCKNHGVSQVCGKMSSRNPCAFTCKTSINPSLIRKHLCHNYFNGDHNRAVEPLRAVGSHSIMWHSGAMVFALAASRVAARVLSLANHPPLRGRECSPTL